MNIELIKQQPEAANIISFWFQKPGGYKHNAGEYTELSLDFPNPDERGNRHWFTISASPTENHLMITTKFPSPDQKISTLKQHLRQLKPGDKVQWAPPMGDFVLPRDHNTKLVFVAGGIGVTPFRSMAKYLTDTNEQPYQIQLIYAANRTSEFAFTELLDNAPGYNVTRIISAAERGWRDAVGRLDSSKITELAEGLEGKTVYLSGPEPMVKSLKDQLIKDGHPEKQVKLDDFPGYTEI